MNSMKRAGCIHLYFGVESGSPRILRMIGRHTTPDRIINAIKITNDAGISCTAVFVSGFPGESIDDLKLSVKLAKKLDATKFRLRKYIPYPGSDLYSEAVKKGFRPPEKTIDFLSLDDYKTGNIKLSEIPDKVLQTAKKTIEFLTIPNSLRFAFKHGYFRFLPFSILEILPQFLNQVILKKRFRDKQKILNKS